MLKWLTMSHGMKIIFKLLIELSAACCYPEILRCFKGIGKNVKASLLSQCMKCIPNALRDWITGFAITNHKSSFTCSKSKIAFHQLLCKP